MKAVNKICIATLLAGVVVCVASCSREEDNIFDTSATVRLQESVSGLKNKLTAAENGWEILYFANPLSGGYVLLADFNADGSVKVAAKNNAATVNRYVEDESLWDVLPEGGSLLTFNSYNKVIHAFSDPRSDGNGLLGDYEMVLLKDLGDTLIFKGKKQEGIIRFIRFPAGQNWVDYFKQIDDMNAQLFENVSGCTMSLIREGESTAIEYAAENIFTWEDSTDVYVSGFVVRPTGIMLNDPIDVNGKEATHFSLNDDGSYLVCSDEGVDCLIRPSYTNADFFKQQLDEYMHWQVNLDSFSESAKADYQAILDGIAASDTETNVRINQIHYMKDADDNYVVAFVYRIDGLLRYGFMTYTITSSGAQTAMRYSAVDTNAQALMRRAGGGDLQTGLTMFQDLFLGSFALESATTANFNFSHIKLTKVQKPANSMVLDLIN